LSISQDIEPALVADTVIRRLKTSAAEISAYWFRVVGDRDAYASAVKEQLSGQPVMVCIVRDSSFNNPNAVAADVMSLIEANRATSEAALFGHPSELHCGVLMLGRSSLAIPQASSPITLPSWFQVRPGETVNILVEDLTWAVDAPLNCAPVKIDDICERLYDLEGSIIARLTAVHDVNHGAGNGFMEVIRQDGDGKYGEILADFAAYHRTISVPSAFRPSLRAGASLVSRLWRIVQSRSPNDLHKPAKGLAAALDLDNSLAFESFAGVITRPANLDSVPSRGLCRSLLVSVSAGCQLVTAAAHADSYRRYPVPLLISFSYELRSSLAEVEAMIRITGFAQASEQAQ
jgi:hypothetical protein